MKQRVLIGLMALFLVLTLAPFASALPLPWLDYSGLLHFDQNGAVTDTDVSVNNVTHIDGTFDMSDSIVTSQVWVDNYFNPTKFYIGTFGSSNSRPILDLIADVLSISSSSSNFYTLSLGNIYINNSIGSQFLDEFDNVISQMTSPVVAVTMGLRWDGTNYANVSGKLAPVPEPATLLLFGTGLTGVGLVGWRRRKRREINQ